MTKPTNHSAPNMDITISDFPSMATSSFSDAGAVARVVVKSSTSDSTIVTTWSDSKPSVAPSRRRRDAIPVPLRRHLHVVVVAV